jgi:hypothetical protein
MDGSLSGAISYRGTDLTTGGGHGYYDTSRHHHTGSAYFRGRLVRPGALVLGWTGSSDRNVASPAALTLKLNVLAKNDAVTPSA